MTTATATRRRQFANLNRTQKLLTADQIRSLPALRATESQGDGAMVLVKFFNPCGSQTWYATEFDPEEEVFFGLVTGMYEDELGYFSAEDFRSVAGRLQFGLSIERDIHFTPCTLEKCRGK
jgi:hypothetical protein